MPEKIYKELAIAWARTVAIAAPAIPICGKGPNPNINIGSNNKLNKSAIIEIEKGVMEFPLAKNTAENEGFKNVKISPAETIVK